MKRILSLLSIASLSSASLVCMDQDACAPREKAGQFGALPEHVQTKNVQHCDAQSIEKLAQTCKHAHALTLIQQADNAGACAKIIPILNDNVSQRLSPKDFRALRSTCKYLYYRLHAKAQINRAIVRERLAEVKALLQAGANPNELDSSENTSLDALMNCHHNDKTCHELAPALIAAGADVNRRSPGLLMPPIHLAMSRCHIPVLKALIKAGANLSYCDKNLGSPLCYASRLGALENVKCLIEAGAVLNQKSLAGNTALHIAVQHGQPLILQLLLHHKADLNITNDSDLTPLQLAAKICASSYRPFPYSGLMRDLLASGAKINQQPTFELLNSVFYYDGGRTAKIINHEIAIRNATRTIYMATCGSNSARAIPAGQLTLHDALLILSLLRNSIEL